MASLTAPVVTTSRVRDIIFHVPTIAVASEKAAFAVVVWHVPVSIPYVNGARHKHMAPEAETSQPDAPMRLPQ